QPPLPKQTHPPTQQPLKTFQPQLSHLKQLPTAITANSHKEKQHIHKLPHLPQHLEPLRRELQQPQANYDLNKP
ncbi:hypothetical protein, partial [Bacillus thuringiensis]|uniref:hypothetical protein n=1 Tax=Bacillus thuringiensis TaxID=1428 RepID=UPI001C93108E